MNDSKYCQLEQMKEQQKRQQTMRDLEMVWHDVQTSNSKQRTERELFIDDCRRREGISIQYFQKDQMVEKVKRECSEVNKEIDEERKILEQISKDEYIIDQRRIAEEKVDRKFMKEAISVSENFYVKFLMPNNSFSFLRDKCKIIIRREKKSSSEN